jgi:hypothetical protein
MGMTDRLNAAMFNLRSAIFEAYAVLTEDGARESGNEYHQRERLLEHIDEILDWRPLASFPAAHLQLLELMIAYWREVEDAADAPLRASPPDPIQ